MQAGLITLNYRTSTALSGHFRRIGTIHVHIDGGTHSEVVSHLLQEAETKGLSGKINTISRAMAGNQRGEFPDVYDSHTPGTGREEFEYFSTIRLDDRDAAIAFVNAVYPVLRTS